MTWVGCGNDGVGVGMTGRSFVGMMGGCAGMTGRSFVGMAGGCVGMTQICPGEIVVIVFYKYICSISRGEFATDDLAGGAAWVSEVRWAARLVRSFRAVRPVRMAGLRPAEGGFGGGAARFFSGVWRWRGVPRQNLLSRQRAALQFRRHARGEGGVCVARYGAGMSIRWGADAVCGTRGGAHASRAGVYLPSTKAAPRPLVAADQRRPRVEVGGEGSELPPRGCPPRRKRILSDTPRGGRGTCPFPVMRVSRRGVC